MRETPPPTNEVRRPNGATRHALDVERQPQRRKPLAVRPAPHRGVRDPELAREVRVSQGVLPKVRRKRRFHRTGIICQLSDERKMGSDHSEKELFQSAPVPHKSPEDHEAAARIRAHLRQQMHERGIHQTELARRIGCDDGNIKRVLEGSRSVGLGQVLRICRGLKITATKLLEEDPPERFSDEKALKNH